jgi:hypothetical protein
MIVAIAEDECTPAGGSRPKCVEDATTWVSMVVYDPKDKGVLTSLINAGLVYHNGTGKDAVVGLTKLGFELYNQIKDHQNSYDE